MSQWDLDDLRLEATPAVQVSGRGSRPPRTSPFLKGPIPLHWLTRAAEGPKRALCAGLAIWHSSALQKRRSEITVSKALREQFGLTRWDYGRARRDLVKLGLITVDQRPGQSARVTIVVPPPPDRAGPRRRGAVT